VGGGVLYSRCGAADFEFSPYAKAGSHLHGAKGIDRVQANFGTLKFRFQKAPVEACVVGDQASTVEKLEDVTDKLRKRGRLIRLVCADSVNSSRP
jgi:hypothetical protein